MTTPTSCAATGPELSADGSVPVPLEKQMWGDELGMCVDRFGVAWIDIGQPQG